MITFESLDRIRRDCDYSSDRLSNAVPNLNHLTGLDGIATFVMRYLYGGVKFESLDRIRRDCDNISHLIPSHLKLFESLDRIRRDCDWFQAEKSRPASKFESLDRIRRDCDITVTSQKGRFKVFESLDRIRRDCDDIKSVSLLLRFNLNHLTGLDGIATHWNALIYSMPYLNHLTGLDGIATS